MTAILIRLLPYLLCLAGGASSAWFIQGNRYELRIANIKLDHAKEDVDAAKKNLDTFVALQDRADKAVKAAQTVAAANRAAAADAGRVAAGLRADLAAARDKLASSTCESVANYAASLSTVFDQCQAEYRGLAEKSDGHASDAKALIEAWPTISPTTEESSAAQ